MISNKLTPHSFRLMGTIVSDTSSDMHSNPIALAFHPCNNFNFEPRRIPFDDQQTIFVGRRNGINSPSPSNGIFNSDVKSLSKLHAHFVVEDTIVYLIDRNSNAGTFYHRIGKDRTQCRPNMPVQVHTDDIIQFGSSSDRSKFILLRLTIIYGSSTPNQRSTLSVRPSSSSSSDCDRLAI